ncbi:DUF4168 domain-containing protein [Myxacorys almedinensis]|nr:DUF4168 domain-containing protein [Myxacorys almedinensis]
MMKRAFSLSARMQQLLAHSLLVGSLSSIALLCGWTPTFSGHSASFDSAAFAQEPPFTRYVRAAVEIEKTRQRLLDQVKQLTGGSVPSNVCHSDNIEKINSGIRDQVKGICDTFAAQAGQIVARNGLKREEFNQFQMKAQQDSGVRSQIKTEIQRLGLR